MAQVTWPISKKPTDFDETTIKEKFQSDFEAGYVQSRKKFTRGRKKFRLVWDDSGHQTLTDDEKEILDQFVNDHAGETILFPHPFKDGVSYNVLFEDDDIEFSLAYFYEGINGEKIRYWSTEIVLIEQ